ncbi:MAG: UDP-N-acetylglucosamine 1-carboxyvinyltransferase [Candidatus Komeilibacteria bacterium]
MAQYKIIGQQKIKGEIAVAGAKNNALKAVPATLLTDEICILHNVPDIEDMRIIFSLMRAIGSQIEALGNGSWRIDNSNIDPTAVDADLAKKLRSSIMFIAPLLARWGEVHLPHPGGCIIGKRPINFFVDGFTALGAKVTVTDDSYLFQAKKLKANNIIFPQMSHTGTESMMMAAALAQGTTTIINAACEPEVVALAEMLNSMGANIVGAGTPTITIQGVDKLSGTEFSIIPDRLEAGSFIALAAANQQGLTITNCNPDHLAVPLYIYKRIGVNFSVGDDYINVKPSHKFEAIKIATHEYPGFPTDLQAPTTVLLTQAEGLSMVHETIYESRLLYTDLLNRMGAHIILCDPHRIIIQGATQLIGKKVESPDLRAGIAMVIAGTIAQGTTIIDNIYQIKRGYSNILERLRAIGIHIEEIDLAS